MLQSSTGVCERVRALACVSRAGKKREALTPPNSNLQHFSCLPKKSCFFQTVESQQGQILPLQDVSLVWINGFQTQLSWAPMANCTYNGSIETKLPKDKQQVPQPPNPWLTEIVMQGGFLKLTVDAQCSDSRRYQAVINKTYPDLVSNLICSVHAVNKTRCTWDPASPDSELRFFFRLKTPTESDQRKSSIQECPQYRKNAAGVRTGCDLKADFNNNIEILFRGEPNDSRNTFKIDLLYNVRPPALNWTVTKTGDKFHIRWSLPEVPFKWKYILNYTECNETKIKDFRNGETSYELDGVVPHCPYRMAVKAESAFEKDGNPRGGTPWSEEKYFEAEQGQGNKLVYATFIIPLIFGGLAVLVFMCCKNHKEKIFPKVPVPRDLLSDIFDNNNKCTVRNLYIPEAEEENCKITLVVDPQISKLDI
ncbi:uncharacterized protein LOC121962394 [Plectropomus leopardus]|uniref:uncharacterized protein LOC121962394 n=1 Tax=Plectropomus leopardus TaxID=160734 RepID=UPI001C4BFEF4|nr:uncharacterized protein LOC121962394 [Plectropomus leopardus]